MYIPLYNKSNYSLLSSLIKIDDLVDYAVSHNIPSIALCDINMYGVMEFIKKCQSNHIKPIVGQQVNLEEFSICLFVKDYDGYQNIIKLSTIQNERVVNSSDIEKYNQRLICVIPYKYREKYYELSKIYDDIYVGYSNKNEEFEVKKITNNVVFFRENLYVDNVSSEILPYLYLIRDGKTVSDDVTYDVVVYYSGDDKDGTGKHIQFLRRPLRYAGERA